MGGYVGLFCCFLDVFCLCKYVYKQVLTDNNLFIQRFTKLALNRHLIRDHQRSLSLSKMFVYFYVTVFKRNLKEA